MPVRARAFTSEPSAPQSARISAPRRPVEDDDDPDDVDYDYQPPAPRPESAADDPDTWRRLGGSRWRSPFLFAVVLVVAAVIAWAASGHRLPTRPATAGPDTAQQSDTGVTFGLPAPVDDSSSPEPSDSSSPTPSASPDPSGVPPTPTSPVPAPGKVVTGAIVSSSGRCVDVKGANDADGTLIEDFHCHPPTKAQSWTVGQDGTLRAMGKCMRVDGDGRSAGSKITLFPCSGAPTEIWKPGPSQSLVNPASGKCLRNGDNAPDDTYLRLAACDGSEDQKWTMPK